MQEGGVPAEVPPPRQPHAHAHPSPSLPPPPPPRPPWPRALLVPLAALVVAVVRFAALPFAAKMSYLPDDAFYYFQLGRQYTRDGLWSFDRGQTLTSGFHLAHAYLVAFVERTWPGDARLGQRLTILAAGAALLTFASLAALVRATGGSFARGRLAAILYVGCAGGIFILPLQAMEWPLAVTASSLAVLGLAREGRGGRAGYLLAPAAFFVAPMCRFDFVVPAACLAVAALASWRRMDRELRRLVLVSLAACALGTVLVSLHTYAISGTLLSSSARTKAFWGSVAGYHLGYGVEPSSYAFGPFLFLTRTLDLGPATLVIPILLVAWLAFSARRAHRELPPRPRLLLDWSALTIVALAVTYGRVGLAAQCWYSALFVAPFFVLVAALAALAPSRAHRPLLVIGGLVAAANLWTARSPVWNQDLVAADCRLLAGDRSIVRAGAWNAGSRSYLGGEKVMNLDGLVNDDVYPYLVADRLHCYLVHERLPFIVDSMAWFDDRARMLGGSTGVLRQNVQPYIIEGGAAGRPQAWRVDLDVLARQPECAADLRSARSRAARPWTPG